MTFCDFFALWNFKNMLNMFKYVYVWRFGFDQAGSAVEEKKLLKTIDVSMHFL